MAKDLDSFLSPNAGTCILGGLACAIFLFSAREVKANSSIHDSAKEIVDQAELAMANPISAKAQQALTDPQSYESKTQDLANRLARQMACPKLSDKRGNFLNSTQNWYLADTLSTWSEFYRNNFSAQNEVSSKNFTDSFETTLTNLAGEYFDATRSRDFAKVFTDFLTEEHALVRNKNESSYLNPTDFVKQMAKTARLKSINEWMNRFYDARRKSHSKFEQCAGIHKNPSFLQSPDFSKPIAREKISDQKTQAPPLTPEKPLPVHKADVAPNNVTPSDVAPKAEESKSQKIENPAEQKQSNPLYETKIKDLANRLAHQIACPRRERNGSFDSSTQNWYLGDTLKSWSDFYKESFSNQTSVPSQVFKEEFVKVINAQAGNYFASSASYEFANALTAYLEREHLLLRTKTETKYKNASDFLKQKSQTSSLNLVLSKMAGFHAEKRSSGDDQSQCTNVLKDKNFWTTPDFKKDLPSHSGNTQVEDPNLVQKIGSGISQGVKKIVESIIPGTNDPLKKVFEYKDFGKDEMHDVESTLDKLFEESKGTDEKAQRLKTLFGDLSDPKQQKTNPMGEVCSNYTSFDEETKKKAWRAFLLSMVAAESMFVRSASDAGDSNRPYGFWQISTNAKDYPEINASGFKNACAFKGKSDLQNNIEKNVECVVAFLSLRTMKDLNVYGDSESRADLYPYSYPGSDKTNYYGALHWSVLRTNHFMKTKFSPVFKKFFPYCEVENSVLSKPASQVKPILNFTQLPGSAEPI